MSERPNWNTGTSCEGNCGHPSVSMRQPKFCLSCHAPSKVEIRGPRGGVQGTKWIHPPKPCPDGCGTMVWLCKPDGKPQRLVAGKDTEPRADAPIHVCPNQRHFDVDLAFVPLPAGLDFAPC